MRNDKIRRFKPRMNKFRSRRPSNGIKNNGIVCSYSSSSIVKPKFDYYSYAPKGINIKIVQAFLQNNKNISLIGNYVNKLMERNKIIHPNIETFRFDVAYKAHDFIENPNKIGKSNIKI